MMTIHRQHAVEVVAAMMGTKSQSAPSACAVVLPRQRIRMMMILLLPVVRHAPAGHRQRMTIRHRHADAPQHADALKSQRTMTRHPHAVRPAVASLKRKMTIRHRAQDAGCQFADAVNR